MKYFKWKQKWWVRFQQGNKINPNMNQARLDRLLLSLPESQVEHENGNSSVSWGIVYPLRRILVFLMLLHKVEREIRLCWPPSMGANVSNHRRWSIMLKTRWRKSRADIRRETEETAHRAGRLRNTSAAGLRSVTVVGLNSRSAAGSITASSCCRCSNTSHISIESWSKFAAFEMLQIKRVKKGGNN